MSSRFGNYFEGMHCPAVALSPIHIGLHKILVKIQSCFASLITTSVAWF